MFSDERHWALFMCRKPAKLHVRRSMILAMKEHEPPAYTAAGVNHTLNGKHWNRYCDLAFDRFISHRQLGVDKVDKMMNYGRLYGLQT